MGKHSATEVYQKRKTLSCTQGLDIHIFTYGEKYKMFTTYVRFVSVRGQFGVHVIVIGQPSGRVIGLSLAIRMQWQELQRKKKLLWHFSFAEPKSNYISCLFQKKMGLWIKLL